MYNHTRIAAAAIPFLVSFTCVGESNAQAIGDFDNDGFADLAVGAPGEDVGSVENAGAVHVIYGTASRLTAARSQFWHLNRPGIDENARRDDAFGSALAVGDFNNDGFDDLAVGIPGRAADSEPKAGAVLVMFGSEDGLRAVGFQIWDQNVFSVVDAPQPDDRFGAALSVGDFDGDGFDDLGIGVPGENHDAGAVHVLHGSADGLTADDDLFLQQGADGIADDAESGDGFGAALGSGDFNGDGFDDLVVGAPDEGTGGALEAGVVHVIMGSADGLDAESSRRWTQNASDVPDACEYGDGFGNAFAAGDFDNDGFEDLAIGVPGESIGFIQQAGGVLVLRGGAGDGLTAIGARWFSQNRDGVQDACEFGDRFGDALASADFDNDGFADLAIGVPGESIGAAIECGATHVLFGANNGLATANAEFWHQDIPQVRDRCEPRDAFGASLAAGDLNGDGFVDLAIGVPDEDVAVADAGAIAVLYADVNGLRAGPDQFWHQNVTDIADACEASDGFGGANAD